MVCCGVINNMKLLNKLFQQLFRKKCLERRLLCQLLSQHKIMDLIIPRQSTCWIVLSLILWTGGLVSCESRDRDFIVFQDPSQCSLSQNETFSTETLGCVQCNWVTGVNIGENCPCPANYKEVVTLRGPSMSTTSTVKCSLCPNKTSVYDTFHCSSCGDLNPYDDSIRKCKPCPAGHIEVTSNVDGSPKSIVECIRCASGLTPDLSGKQCIRCHSSFVNSANGTCSCPELSHTVIDDICFATTDIADPNLSKTGDRKPAHRIEYDHSKMESLLFRDNSVSAFYLCKALHNETACQILTNLCTLNMHTYSDSEWSTCRLYRSLYSGPINHPPPYVPKLYYSELEAPTILMKATAIPHVYDMDFTRSTSDINITMSRLSFNGTFLGLTSLHEMTPCTEQLSHQRISQKFGSTYQSSCSISIQDVWGRYKSKMEFLESYVSYETHDPKKKNGHPELHMYSIPVKIQNFKKHGVRSNNADDKFQWQLVKRFFIVDTIGGFGTDKEDTVPNRVRYANSISVSIQLQNDKDPGKIYVPLITVSYKEVSKEDFLRDINVEFSYTVNYSMDMSRSLEDVKISIGVMSALAVIWAAIQTWSQNRRNGKVEIDIETIFHLLFISCGHLADAFFIVCFSTSLYWLLFFKEQMAVHVLLPRSDQELLIRDLLISAFSLKIVDVLRLVLRQVTVDIFFVDWERPRARNTIQPPNEALRNDPSLKPGETNMEKNSEGNVSIWRTYFIANEWNEIQAIRKIHISSQIILSILFLEIVGFKYWGLHWPDSSLNPGPEVKNIPYSSAARFAVGSLVFGLIGICQWLYTDMFYERFVVNRIHDFVDVCTLANISVFILAAKQQGYYIHGRSVHGFADTDMQTMIEQLSREEEDLCGRRGLLPSTDQQTFLISVPSTFRSVYNQVLQPLYASSNANGAFLGKGRLLGTTGSKTAVVTKPTANMINLSILAYHSMNRFLTAFLEHALSDLDYDVTDKSFFEATFDMEFNEVGNDRAVFYTDNGHSFDAVLFHGNERTLFMFNLYTFLFVDILSHSFVLAGIITFLSDLIVKKLRSWLGRRNLAQKTLIDSRFLI